MAGKRALPYLDLLKVVGKKNISQMVVKHGDLPWQNP